MGAAVSVVDFDARRPRRPLRHQQQGRLAEPAVSQPRRRHVRGHRGAARRRRPQPRRAPACRWARSGATTTTTASRTCSSIAGAGRSCSTTTAASGFTRVTEHGRAAGAGRTSTPRSGSTSTATAGSISSSAATTPETVNLWKLADTKMMPESFEYANNGGRKYLFRNLGGGRFEEVSAQVGLDLAALGAGGGGRRPARHRLSRPLHRQRLRRLGAVRQRGRPLPRGRPRDAASATRRRAG